MVKRKRDTKHIIHCGQHKEIDLCDECVVLKPLHRFNVTKLPRNGEVLSRLLDLNAEKPNVSNSNDLAHIIAYLWILTNIYTTGDRLIIKKIDKLYSTFRSLQKYTKKKKGLTFLNQLREFKGSLLQLFDIKCNDINRNKSEAQKWGVKMEREDNQFYELQKCTPPIGSCTNTVDRHALAKTVRAQKRIKYENNQRIESEKYQMELEGCVMDHSLESVLDSEMEPHNSDATNDSDATYIPEASNSSTRYNFEHIVDDENDEMPEKYRHVRDGMRSVRPEIYQAAHALNSKYHMTMHQIEGAFLEIGKVFGRNWKVFKPNSITDKNTLPSMTNLVRTRKYLEAMALNNIVEEIMSSDGSSITYANDGSSLNRTGSYVVQSITINGIQRALPTLSITTESHETLKELELTTFKMLSAASGYKYSEAEIFKKVTFVMTDSTAHNIGVTEMVCDELDINDADRPDTLLCNIHPLMLFQNKMKEFYGEIQQSFGTKKLDECFTVDIDFKDENFVLKAIKCLTNFINKENNAKPWNRHSHFSKFISPKKNDAISLKDHRFNRLNDCCLVILYHLSYLDK